MGIGAATYFDGLAEDYENLPFVRGRDPAREVDRIIGVLLPDHARLSVESRRLRRVLDIGCGTGRLTWEIARRGYQVHGIDISSRMLEEAARHSESLFVRPRFSLADFFSLESEEPYDFAVSVMGGAFGVSAEAATANYKEAAQFFGSLRRVLKPGGQALIEFLHGACVLRELAEEDLTGGAVLFDRGKIADGGIYESYYTVTELSAAAEAQGLSVRRISGPVTGSDFPSSLRLADSVGVVHVVAPH